MFKPLLIVVIAYLLGSIPFGYLIVRASKRADIRETGSGGTGATNVSRRAGKGAGVLTLVDDDTEIIPGVRHFTPEDAPRPVADAIAALLAR